MSNDKNSSWLEKYRPKELNDYLNYKELYQVEIEEWIKPFLNNKDTFYPFLILYGPPAYGKTTLAHCIFEYFDYETLECNASDTRNKTQLEKIIKTGKYSFTESKTGKGYKKYGLLLDELDGLSSGDNGGIDTIMNTVFISKEKKVKNNYYKVRYPVICTTNSIKEKKLQTIIRFSKIIHLKKPSFNSLYNLSKIIIKNEKIPITLNNIKKYISINDDYRSIITKLHNLFLDCKKVNTLKDKKALILKQINSYIENENNNRYNIIKFNHKSALEIIQELTDNFKKYDFNNKFKIIETFNQNFYMSVLSNYSSIIKKSNNNKLTEIINNFNDANTINIYYKKNKNDYNDLTKYITIIHIYTNLKIISELNNTKIKFSYHKKYNDMKQETSFIFNNLNYNYQHSIENKYDEADIINVNNIFDNVLKKIKIKKTDINNNYNIFNNIIDVDIINMLMINDNKNSFNLSKTFKNKIDKF